MDGSSVFSLVPVALRPQSHGTVTLQSRDVFDARKFLPAAVWWRSEFKADYALLKRSSTRST
jgi:hypothetical protein